MEWTYRPPKPPDNRQLAEKQALSLVVRGAIWSVVFLIVGLTLALLMDWYLLTAEPDVPGQYLIVWIVAPIIFAAYFVAACVTYFSTE